MAKKVFIACDHGGFLLKSAVAEAVAGLGFAVVDLGCFDGAASVDYNDYAATLAHHVQRENIAAFAGGFGTEFLDKTRAENPCEIRADNLDENCADNPCETRADNAPNSNLTKISDKNRAQIFAAKTPATSADICASLPAELAEKIATNEPAAFGVLLCGTGLGMSIAANRAALVRAALCHDQTTARLAREHNNANVLCIGARVVGETLARDIVGTFFGTGFAGGRHARRVCKLG